MPRRYSTDDKARALAALDANNGNLRKTSAQTGIPASTLRKWRQKRQEVEQDPMQRLRQQLIDNALKLAEKLKDANGSVTFNQRATALNQMVDKIIKLAEKIPEEGDTQEKVLRIEYVDPDGTVHPSPRWARDDSEDEDAVQGGGVWSPFWQDGDGEDSDR